MDKKCPECYNYRFIRGWQDYWGGFYWIPCKTCNADYKRFNPLTLSEVKEELQHRGEWGKLMQE